MEAYWSFQRVYRRWELVVGIAPLPPIEESGPRGAATSQGFEGVS